MITRSAVQTFSFNRLIVMQTTFPINAMAIFLAFKEFQYHSNFQCEMEGMHCKEHTKE